MTPHKSSICLFIALHWLTFSCISPIILINLRALFFAEVCYRTMRFALIKLSGGIKRGRESAAESGIKRCLPMPKNKIEECYSKSGIGEILRKRSQRNCCTYVVPNKKATMSKTT